MVSHIQKDSLPWEDDGSSKLPETLKSLSILYLIVFLFLVSIYGCSSPKAIPETPLGQEEQIFKNVSVLPTEIYEKASIQFAPVDFDDDTRRTRRRRFQEKMDKNYIHDNLRLKETYDICFRNGLLKTDIAQNADLYGAGDIHNQSYSPVALKLEIEKFNIERVGFNSKFEVMLAGSILTLGLGVAPLLTLEMTDYKAESDCIIKLIDMESKETVFQEYVQTVIDTSASVYNYRSRLKTLQESLIRNSAAEMVQGLYGELKKNSALKNRMADLSRKKMTPQLEIGYLPGAPENIAPLKSSVMNKTVSRANAPGKIFAVIIGISRYKYAENNLLKNLPYADDDAKALKNVLLDLGWSESHMKVLINENASRRNILITLESWLTKAGPDDLIVLYWSGHGFPDPEDPEKVYFACYDTDINIPATGYRMDNVRRILRERNPKNVVIFADTCHAGKLITRGKRSIGMKPYLNKLTRENQVPKGWIFMVGADTDRDAIEHSSWSNGAFTHSLIKGLSGSADGYQSIGEKDNIVTMGELRGYLNGEMPEETQKILGVAKRPIITTSTGDPGIWNLTLRNE